MERGQWGGAPIQDSNEKNLLDTARKICQSSRRSRPRHIQDKRVQDNRAERFGSESGCAAMVSPLDVFAIANGGPTWLGCAETQAKALELVGSRGPGSYFVFSQQTGNKTFYEVVANDTVRLLEDRMASNLNARPQISK
jgi:hypothetical protein